MTEYEQINECVMDMFRIFANLLSKHTLKKHMTADEILSLLDIKSTPAVKAKPVITYEGDLDDLPEGLSKARATAVLSLCKQGVPEDHFVHSVHKKVFKPTKQHDNFYFDKTARIAGPKGKDGKEKKVIKYLAKKAGEVGPPPEEDVVPQLPAKWKGDRKKVKNMLKKVEDRKDDTTYINWSSSRAIKPDHDDMVYNDAHKICGSKKEKATFLNLVAWLDQDTGKSEKSSESSKSEKSSESSKSEKSSESSKSEKSSESSKSEKSSESSKSDGTDSSDDEDDDAFYIDGYDKKKLAKLKDALENRENKNKEYIDIDTYEVVKSTNRTKQVYYFNKEGFAFEKQKTAAKTKAKSKSVVKMLNQ